MRGEPVSLQGPYLLADNGLVHDETLALFDEISQGNIATKCPD